MKYTIIILIYLFSINSFACQLSIPESYVPTFLSPPVSGHYEKCEKEPCHCVDNVDPYISELIDNEVIDYLSKVNELSCLDEKDCDALFESLVCNKEEQKVKNYDQLQVYCAVPVMKIDGKKLVNSEVKKAAHEAAKKAEKDAQELKILNKKALKLSIKNDIKEATTVAKLRALVEKLIEVGE